MGNDANAGRTRKAARMIVEGHRSEVGESEGIVGIKPETPR